MALSAVRGRAAARWACVAVLILGLAVAATPAAAAGLPGPARPAVCRTHRAWPSLAFPAGLWRPADGPGTWGPLKAARPAAGLPAPAAGPAAPGSPWQLQRSPNPVIHNGMLVADSCAGRGVCVAVGGYENRSGTQVTLAEARTGTGWRIKATPVPAGAIFSNLFGVSCTAADSCTAAGYYTDAARHIHPLAERWNGTSWSIQAVPSPAGHPESGFFAVSCTAANACTAVGAQTGSTGVTAALAERWNGTSWSIQAVPASRVAGQRTPRGVVLRGDRLHGRGQRDRQLPDFRAARGGLERHALEHPGRAEPGGIARLGAQRAVLQFPGRCTAARSDDTSGGSTALLAEAWNGTSWHIQATPGLAGFTGSEFLAVSCSAAAACTAVGATTISTPGGRGASGGTSMTVSLAERWNGTSWRIQATPNPGRSVGTGLAAVSCSAATACTAAGSYDTTSHLTRTTAAAWGGRSWHRQATPSPACVLVSSGLVGVSCASARACTAAGFGTNNAGEGTTLTERWDGTRWRIPAPPLSRPPAVSSSLNGVSCSAPGTCTAVGLYFTPGQRDLALAERWSGGQWRLEVLSSPGYRAWQRAVRGVVPGGAQLLRDRFLFHQGRLGGVHRGLGRHPLAGPASARPGPHRPPVRGVVLRTERL